MRWTQAGGPYQFPFMGAGSRTLAGEHEIACPRCAEATLRGYFHAFKPETGRGTLWVWCPRCRTTTHLPRVTPKAEVGPDPFADLSLEQFDALERSEPLLDRLDRLWEQGALWFASTRGARRR